jgi:hypothetical protein
VIPHQETNDCTEQQQSPNNAEDLEQPLPDPPRTMLVAAAMWAFDGQSVPIRLIDRRVCVFVQSLKLNVLLVIVSAQSVEHYVGQSGCIVRQCKEDLSAAHHAGLYFHHCAESCAKRTRIVLAPIAPAQLRRLAPFRQQVEEAYRDWTRVD